VTPSQIDNCVYTCARINKTNPEIPCSIGINYSPWHRKFRPDLSFGTIPGQYNYTIFDDPSYDAEIKQFVLRMTLVKQWIKQCNENYKTDVKVGAILLDSERFGCRKNDEKWNQCMCEALDAIQKETVALFPDARIEWYGRGIVRTDGVTFSKTIYFTGKEIMSALSCSFYTLPDIEGMRETFRRTCNLADTLNVQDVTPWVALGSGYKPDPVKKLIWTDNWDYDLSYSRQIGAELNDMANKGGSETYPPYNRAKVVVFFPNPFNPLTPNGRNILWHIAREPPKQTENEVLPIHHLMK